MGASPGVLFGRYGHGDALHGNYFMQALILLDGGGASL
jgi:hypothetical protein